MFTYQETGENNNRRAASGCYPSGLLCLTGVVLIKFCCCGGEFDLCVSFFHGKDMPPTVCQVYKMNISGDLQVGHVGYTFAAPSC